MGKIYLVRHGQTHFNVERRIQGQMESDLTEEGIHQATALGQHLKEIEFAALYVSPLRRTLHTAQYVTQKWAPLPTYPREELKEILMGDWQGILVDDLTAQYPEEMETFWHHPENFHRPTCESYKEVRDRGAQLMEEIAQKYPHDNVLVITHGALLKTLYTYFKYQSIHDIANAPHPHSTGLSIVEKKDGVWNVWLWDDTSHLDGK